MVTTNNNQQSCSTIVELADKAHASVIFSHGAGADKSSDFMSIIAEKLVARGINVLRFNFPYMDKRLIDGRKYPPNRMPVLIDCFLKVLTEQTFALPTFVMGKSMGGRVGATLMTDIDSQAIFNIKGAICLGYPFHPQKKPESLRLEPLQLTQKPILVVQGERDALGNKDEIEQYSLSPLCQVEFLADGDHDLKPRVKSGFTHQQHINSTIGLIMEFINEYK